MKARILLLLLFPILGLMAGCHQDQHFPTPPVPVDQMADLVMQLQVAEAYSMGLGQDSVGARVNLFLKNSDSLYIYYSSILKKHDLTYPQFEKAMSWYEEHPKLLDSVLDLSLEQFSREISELKVDPDDPRGREQIIQDAPEVAPMPSNNSQPKTREFKIRPDLRDSENIK